MLLITCVVAVAFGRPNVAEQALEIGAEALLVLIPRLGIGGAQLGWDGAEDMGLQNVVPVQRPPSIIENGEDAMRAVKRIGDDHRQEAGADEISGENREFVVVIINDRLSQLLAHIEDALQVARKIVAVRHQAGCSGSLDICSNELGFDIAG